MNIAYGIDAQRKRMKRRAATEVHRRPGVRLADLSEELDGLFGRDDAAEVLAELCEDVFVLSAEGGLYLQTNWAPQPGDEIDP